MIIMLYHYGVLHYHKNIHLYLCEFEAEIEKHDFQLEMTKNIYIYEEEAHAKFNN